MEFLTELWLPILVAAALVFVMSAILHMATPLHADECRKAPQEDALRQALRNPALAPGNYSVPRPDSMKDMCSPEMLAKYEEGPVALVTVMANGAPRMGRCLLQWFLFCILVSIFCAYIGWTALGPSPSYLAAFRLTGTVAFAGYSLGGISESIWRGRLWSTTCRYLFGGLLYALLTAGAFGWLWA
jgi:hypothetical protein